MSTLFPNFDSTCTNCGQLYDSWSQLCCPCQYDYLQRKSEAAEVLVRERLASEAAQRARDVETLNAILAGRAP